MRWRSRRVTIRQLSQLDDHLLKDIGISRGDIGLVADQLAKSMPAPDARTLQVGGMGQNKPATTRQSKLHVPARWQRRDLQCSKPC